MNNPTELQNDIEQQRALALTIKCTYCGARIGEPCTNKANNQPLKYAAAHTPRLLDSIPF